MTTQFRANLGQKVDFRTKFRKNSDVNFFAKYEAKRNKGFLPLLRKLFRGRGFRRTVPAPVAVTGARAGGRDVASGGRCPRLFCTCFTVF